MYSTRDSAVRVAESNCKWQRRSTYCAHTHTQSNRNEAGSQEVRSHAAWGTPPQSGTCCCPACAQPHGCSSRHPRNVCGEYRQARQLKRIDGGCQPSTEGTCLIARAQPCRRRCGAHTPHMKQRLAPPPPRDLHISRHVAASGGGLQPHAHGCVAHAHL